MNLETKGTGNAEDTVTKKMSFKEKCKDLKEGTVVLMGDSMIRGVGEKMRRDNIMFTPIANGGARIESITWSLKNKQVTAAERRVTPCSHGGNEQPQGRGYRSDNEQVQGADRDYEGGEVQKADYGGDINEGR